MASSFICSYCQHTEFITAKQIQGYAGIISAKQKLFFDSQNFYHDISKNCGDVAHSYIERPEKLN